MKYILCALSIFTSTPNIHAMLARARCMRPASLSSRHTSHRQPSRAKTYSAPAAQDAFNSDPTGEHAFKKAAIYNEMLKKRNHAIGNIGLAGACILALSMELVPQHDGCHGGISLITLDGVMFGGTLGLVYGLKAYNLWKQYNKYHLIQK
jgi:hypothetical protein